MSFTTISKVKIHLLQSGFPALNVETEPVTLTGETDTGLCHHNVVEASESVKWEKSVAPEHEGPIAFSGLEWIQLSGGQIVRGSVVITAGDSLCVVYTEERDYQVNYAAGRLRRVQGSIPDNQPLHVYYRTYSMFSRGSDYAMDYGLGLIHRVSSGGIPDGARVLMDYSVAAGCVSDELILQAISEAEDLIARSLSVAYNSSSTDLGLSTGATQLVLSMLARDMAADVLSTHSGSDAASRAKEWQNLSTLHETRAWATLRPFLDPYAVHAPEKGPHV